jgi:hypothetical protein
MYMTYKIPCLTTGPQLLNVQVEVLHFLEELTSNCDFWFVSIAAIRPNTMAPLTLRSIDIKSVTNNPRRLPASQGVSDIANFRLLPRNVSVPITGNNRL